jgi:hypothetical protein
VLSEFRAPPPRRVCPRPLTRSAPPPYSTPTGPACLTSSARRRRQRRCPCPVWEVLQELSSAGGGVWGLAIAEPDESDEPVRENDATFCADGAHDYGARRPAGRF